jgi:hypothetical protein
MIGFTIAAPSDCPASLIFTSKTQIPEMTLGLEAKKALILSRGNELTSPLHMIQKFGLQSSIRSEPFVKGTS